MQLYSIVLLSCIEIVINHRLTEKCFSSTINNEFQTGSSNDLVDIKSNRHNILIYAKMQKHV